MPDPIFPQEFFKLLANESGPIVRGNVSGRPNLANRALKTSITADDDVDGVWLLPTLSEHQ